MLKVCTLLLLAALMALCSVRASGPTLTPWGNFITMNRRTCPGNAQSPCVIGPNQAVLISAQDVNVRSMTVYGTLVIRPNARNENMRLTTAFLIASGPNAVINVTAADPTDTVVIYLRRNPQAYNDVPDIPQKFMFTGGRVFGGANGARIFVEGAPVNPHFTLLARHVYSLCGSSICPNPRALASIYVVHDVTSWIAGSDLVIAPSDQQYNVWASRLAIRPGAFQGKIVRVVPEGGVWRIDLDRQIPGFNFSAVNPPYDTPNVNNNTYNRDTYPVYYGDPALGHQAEVFILNRNIQITGDDFSARWAPIPQPPWQNPLNNSRINNGWPVPWSRYANSKAPVEGLHTLIAGNNCTLPNPCNSGGGWMKMRYAYIEKAGQRGWVGRYPLHLHRMGNCPECELVGNVVYNTQQRGVAIHSTGNALVDSNIVFNHKGAGIYVEEGTEVGNTISNNVVVCGVGVVSYTSWNSTINNWQIADQSSFPGVTLGGGACQLSSLQDFGDPSVLLGGCRIQGTDNEQADCVQQAGLWALSATNNILHNHVVNNYNCIYFQSTLFMDGRIGTDSLGRVCPIHSNWGQIKNNTCVAHQRFGFYPDVNYPREVKRSVATDGYVQDLLTQPLCMADLTNDATWCSCRANTLDGGDNGQNLTYIEDQKDIGSGFVGQYDLGDVQYKNLRVLQSNIGLYWKGSKNMKYDSAKGLQAHVKNSTFFYDISMYVRIAPWAALTATYFLNVPGISGTFLIENVVFKGDPNVAGWVRTGDQVGAAGGALGVNQQCKGYLSGVAEGQLCTPQVLLKNVDFSQIKDTGNNNNNPPLPQDQRPTWIKFGAESGNPFLGMVVAFDDSLCGKVKVPCPYKAIVPKYSTHLLNLPGNPCEATIKPQNISGNGYLPQTEAGDWSRRFYNGIMCRVQTRRLTIWGKAQNTSVNPVDLILIPPGKTAQQGFRMQWMAFNRAYDSSQGTCPWSGEPCCMGTECPVDEPRRFAEGYGGTVIPQEYLPGQWSLVRADGQPIDTSKITLVELSDVMFDGIEYPGPDTLQMTLNGRLCTLRSTDWRKFMTQYGPTKRIQSGGSCVREWLQGGLTATRFPTTTAFPSRQPTRFPSRTAFPTRRPTRFPSAN